MNAIRCGLVTVILCGVVFGGEAADAPGKELTSPRLIGHRGLIKHAPENTLTGFGACLDLRIGFELDVRRTRDGHLVCMHDDSVNRTTDGTGKIADLTLAELKKLDAGRKFDPAFAGERVPTLDEVFALLRQRQSDPVLVAIDHKIDDATVEADVVRLAVKNQVLNRLVHIGRAITEPSVRRKLREANAGAHVAVLAQTVDDLPKALADADADWIYIRFLPTVEQVAQIHKAGKRVFASGPKFIGREPENWLRARETRVDVMLSDYPIECRPYYRAGEEQKGK